MLRFAMTYTILVSGLSMFWDIETFHLMVFLNVMGIFIIFGAMKDLPNRASLFSNTTRELISIGEAREDVVFTVVLSAAFFDTATFIGSCKDSISNGASEYLLLILLIPPLGFLLFSLSHSFFKGTMIQLIIIYPTICTGMGMATAFWASVYGLEWVTVIGDESHNKEAVIVVLLMCTGSSYWFGSKMWEMVRISIGSKRAENIN